MGNQLQIRLATPEDIPRLEVLTELSVRELQKSDYSAAQIEGALGTVFGVDSQLIADGTYFVVEAGEARTITGCGGWSRRNTLFGSDHSVRRNSSLLDPFSEAAKIRAFFVHPDWVRRGIASRILAACEDAARLAGFRRFELGATLTGVPLYTANGYSAVEQIQVRLANGASLPVIRMSKVS